MASDVEIVNVALTALGESRIISLDDDVKPAREAKAIFTKIRDALLASFNWNFAKARASLPALVAVPAFGYARKFQLPANCLRVTFVGDYYVGADLTDYRGIPTDEYAIEGREILTNLGDPLNIKYVKQVTDPTQFGAAFTDAFGCRLARDLAVSLTNSVSKKNSMNEDYKVSIRDAIRANAIELPPSKLPDDEWLLSRR